MLCHMSITSRGLHIVNGESAAGTFVAAFGNHERLLIQCDMLSCGPTPRCADLVQWERLRLVFLNNFFKTEEPWSFRDLDRDLLISAQRLAGDDDIYVWAGTTVEDQLLIAFVLYLIDTIGGDPRRLQVVQFELIPGGTTRILGLGMLNPRQLRDHPTPRRPLATELDHYRQAWAALTDSTPDSLVAFCERNDESMPYLRDALRAMLRRYPALHSGLFNWDRILLEQARQRGPRAARIIGYSITHDWHDVDWIGDLYLYQRLQNLAATDLPQPLLKLSAPGLSMRETDVTLTEFGAAVLDGNACFHRSNPIDEWIGGVRLSSAESRLWFLDEGRLVRA